MLSATTGRVASITGLERSESNVFSSPVAWCPPLAAVTFRSYPATRFAGSEASQISRACRATGRIGLFVRRRASSAAVGPGDDLQDVPVRVLPVDPATAVVGVDLPGLLL